MAYYLTTYSLADGGTARASLVSLSLRSTHGLWVERRITRAKPNNGACVTVGSHANRERIYMTSSHAMGRIDYLGCSVCVCVCVCVCCLGREGRVE